MPASRPLLPKQWLCLWLPVVALFALLALVAWAFLPGLGGKFIFDDQPNLQPWAEFGDIRTLKDVIAFSFSSNIFPGRPLSLLSFLVDDQSWPPDVFALKRSNLALHLVNACLIFWFCLKLMQQLLPSRDARTRIWLALFATAIWSLHPLQVSNVSYIIQRMNLLSTSLELAGLLLFMHGREQLERAPVRALLLCSVGTGLFTPLAILAKENGLLLCVFALLIEGMCYPASRHRWWRWWKLAFLWAPLALFVVYCAITYRGFTIGYEARNYNAWERLLTQGPVVVDYLHKLLVPRLHGTGLYLDNFPISHSLLQPLSTLFCWLLLIALITAGLLLRRRQPLIAFGILFYFCGHLMESTVMPLELYFEHRNYLPQIGLWLALAGLLGLALQVGMRPLLLGVSLLMLLLLTGLTRSNSALWSQPELQTAIWYKENPGSLRNTLAYSNLLLQTQEYPELESVLARGVQEHPRSFSLQLSQRVVSCYAQDKPTRFDDLAAVAAHSDYETSGIVMLERMRTQYRTQPPGFAAQRHCPFASDLQIAGIYQGFLKNEKYRHTTAHGIVLQYLAETATDHRDGDTAMAYYDDAFAASGNPIYPFRQALLLEKAGATEKALTYAGITRRAMSWRQRQLHPDFPARIDELENRLKATLRRATP